MLNEGELKVVEGVLGVKGHMVSASKSRYTYNNPDHYVVFNAGLYITDGVNLEKIWYGDLDLSTNEIEALQFLSKELNKEVLVFHESDERFVDKVDINDMVVAIYDTNIEIGEKFAEYIKKVDNKLYRSDAYVRKPRNLEEAAAHHYNICLQEREQKKSDCIRLDILHIDFDSYKPKSDSDDEIPFIKFYEDLKSRCPVTQDNCDAVFIHPDDMTILNLQLIEYLRMRFDDEYTIEQEFSWAALSTPSTSEDVMRGTATIYLVDLPAANSEPLQ